MRRWLGHPALLWACRLLVGLLFIASSLGKLSNPTEFLGSVDQYQMLPKFAVAVWAGGLPGVEMLSGLLLIFSPWWRASALLICGLFLVFIAALISVIFRHMQIDCSCMDIILSWAGAFGQSPWLTAHAPGLARRLLGLTEGSHLVSWNTVLRDVYFLVPTALVAFSPRPRTAQAKTGPA